MRSFSTNPPSSGAISNQLVWAFLLFALTTGATLFYLVTEHHTEMAERNARLTAEITAENINHFRTYYSREVIGNVKNSETDVTHEFRQKPGSIPLPATLSIELGEFLQSQHFNIGYKMFSAYPFP